MQQRFLATATAATAAAATTAATNLINNRQTGRISCSTLNSTINYRYGQPAIIQIERLIFTIFLPLLFNMQHLQHAQASASSITTTANALQTGLIILILLPPPLARLQHVADRCKVQL